MDLTDMHGHAFSWGHIAQGFEGFEHLGCQGDFGSVGRGGFLKAVGSRRLESFSDLGAYF